MADPKIECPYCGGDGLESWGSDPDTGRTINSDCPTCEGEGEVNDVQP